MTRTEQLAQQDDFSQEDLDIIFTMTHEEYQKFSWSRSGLRRWFRELDDRERSQDKY